MKKLLLSTFGSLAFLLITNAQTYTSANYATIGDSVFLTKAQTSTADFVATGTNFTWNYTSLIGVSQTKLKFLIPRETGFTQISWPFVYNTNNTNLASTNGETKTLSSQNLTMTSVYDYFKNGTADLRQVASAYKIVYGGISIPVKNQFSSADVVYKFPLAMFNKDSSTSGFTTNIPGTYYQKQTLKRKNVVDGTGTITTPYGVFSNTLRLTSTITQTDTFSVLGNGIPSTTRTYRELKWLQSTQKYPLLIVVQNKVGNAWVTSSVEFMDVKKFFQPLALFAYSPAQPIQATAVIFQNLCTNATSFKWNFADPGSGALNQSTEANPNHTFQLPGTYQVKLKAYNGVLIDSVTIPVVVNSNLLPDANFTFAVTGTNCLDYTFTNTSINAQTYSWKFGDTASLLNNNSVSTSPTHKFSGKGSFMVRLIASNGSLKDTIIKQVNVSGNLNVSINISTPNNTVQPGAMVVFTANPGNGGLQQTFQWKKNNVSVGNNSSTFSTNAILNGDQISCILTSSEVCAINPTATSNTIQMTVNSNTAAAAPVINSVPSSSSDSSVVSMSTSTSGATMYYTTSGDNPVIGSGFTMVYTGPFTIYQTTTVKAFAFKAGLENSPIASFQINITNPRVAATPEISLENNQTIVMSSATASAKIFYTTNGSEPSENPPNSASMLYVNPLQLSSSATIKAMAVRLGFQNSPITTFNFVYTSIGEKISNNPESANKFLVFPNPSLNGVFNFSTKGLGMDNSNIEIRTINGQKVEDFTITNHQDFVSIDLSQKPKGIYLARISVGNVFKFSRLMNY